MTQPKNIKRVSLYFNLDVESEYRMWEFLENRKKNYEIKKAIEIAIVKENENSKYYSDIPSLKDRNSIEEDEMDIEGIDF